MFPNFLKNLEQKGKKIFLMNHLILLNGSGKAILDQRFSMANTLLLLLRKKMFKLMSTFLLESNQHGKSQLKNM